MIQLLFLPITLLVGLLEFMASSLLTLIGGVLAIGLVITVLLVLIWINQT